MMVVDFDDTCTITDTIGLLMSRAVHGRLESRGHTDAGLPAMLSENYLIKHKQLLSLILPEDITNDSHISGSGGGEQSGSDSSEIQRNTGGSSESTMRPSRPLDVQGLHEFLFRLSDFDEEMNRVASEKGAVAGLTMHQVLLIMISHLPAAIV